MCGFAGIFRRDTDSPAIDVSELTRMRDTMVSRGPDGEGTWVSQDGRLGLAHRRLAVIDPRAGANQPMVDPVTGNVIVFNGEIYNYKALRRECESRGAVFQTESDTEVLLALYREYGEAMFDRLRGMFAFGLWDAMRRRLFLARDPLGIKPLYYADDGKVFRFASQVKALIAGGVPDSPSAAGIAGFYVWGHVPEPWTWAEAVRALPAGCTMTVSAGSPAGAPRRYFDLREEILRAQDSAPPGVKAAQEVVSWITDSVRHHLVADVPVGVFLSAGRDSALISSLAARASAEPPRTLTLGFDEFHGSHNDEVPFAERVAAAIGARHTTVHVTRADFESELERLHAAMDQPTIDGVNTYFVSRAAAAAGLKVALSGLGGDELFGGYPSFRQVPRLTGMLRLFGAAPRFGRALRAVSAPLARWLGKPKAAGLIEYGNSISKAYLLRRALFMPWELPRVMDPHLASTGLRQLALEEELHSLVSGIRNPVLAVMALEMSCYMRNQLLRDADWAGMAHSLEIRVPLVDVELFRLWLPFAVHRLPLDRQQLLEAADPAVACILSGRRKSGFSTPLALWWRASWRTNNEWPGLRPWAAQLGRRFAPAVHRIRPIVLLTDAFGGIGGIAKFNRDLLRALAAMPECRRIDAFPRLVQRRPEPLPARVRYHFEAARSKWAFTLSALRSGWDRSPAHLVICGHLNLLPVAWAVHVLKRCPLMVIVHGVEAWTPHKSRLVRLLLRRVDRVVSVSRYTAQKLTGWSGVPPERIAILPNCIDLEFFSPRAPNAEMQQRYGLPGKRVLLTVGRLDAMERYKGFDEVLEVLPDLIRDHQDLVYVIVGEGSDRPRLMQKASDLGVSDHVVFTGFISEEEKRDVYALADVYLMPGRGEGFGIVYLEAMAMGVPAIASTADGSRDAVLDGKLGQVVDPNDPAGLIQAIRTALSLPRKRPEGLEYFGEHA
ncbi:MAG: asparagine synthase (glutamine-hydrolyzing) [Bryobacteraceae bacterium]